jgi:simple sugar transport system permease protein
MDSRKVIQFTLDNLFWLLLIAAVILFSVLTDTFLTQRNILNIARHSAVLGMLVVGQSFTLITGNFDLSAESTVGLAGYIAAAMMAALGAPLNILGVVVLLLIGLIVGWVNGFLITRLKMNNFIVTLAMLLILRGIVLGMSKGITISGLPDWFRFLGHYKIADVVPVITIVTLITFIVAYIVTQHTKFGRDMYAIGGSPKGALAAGIDPQKRIRQVYLISGVLAAFAGWLLAGRLGAIPPRMGAGMIFEVQAAAVIGGISLMGGRGTMLGALGGVLLLASINSGLTLMQVNSFVIDAIRGGVILLAVFIDSQKARFSAPSISAVKVKPTSASPVQSEG